MTSHTHRTHRSGWLRAGVLGANDGVLSISSLLLGMASAHVTPANLLIAGFAGLVGGALSMAAGEYVSVSSQADTERADLEMERAALQHDFDAEHAELKDIYIRRGVDPELASHVSYQLMEHDALGAHARDDIGITDALSARPMQAAVASACSFLLGGIVPILSGILAPSTMLIPVTTAISLICLTSLGAIAARAGGASMWRGAVRVLIWGIVVMGLTGISGTLLGTRL